MPPPPPTRRLTIRGLAAVLVAVLVGGCERPEPASARGGSAEQEAPAPAPLSADAAVAQSVYVPVYSHIYDDGDREIDLAVTLSVRNTDPEHPIVIASVTYHDSDGRRVRQYGEGPVALGPLASRAYVVAERDRAGGVGANFVVEWEAAERVSAPVIEAVMISTASTQGISFLSRGEVVRQRGSLRAGAAPLPAP